MMEDRTRMDPHHRHAGASRVATERTILYAIQVKINILNFIH